MNEPIYWNQVYVSEMTMQEFSDLKGWQETNPKAPWNMAIAKGLSWYTYQDHSCVYATDPRKSGILASRVKHDSDLPIGKQEAS